MSKFRYALVSWTKGPDKGAVSIVPTSWIVDFDPADTSKTYLVECRMANTKKPANGWQVEDAVVLQLAGKFLLLILTVTVILIRKVLGQNAKRVALILLAT